MIRRQMLKGLLASSALMTARLPNIGRAAEIQAKAATPDPDWRNPQESTPRVKPVEQLVTPETKTALQRGLRYLAGRQVVSGRFQGAFGSSGYASGTAVTSLAGLAFMCNGSTPFDGPFAANIRRCTDYLLRHTSDRGYISSPGNQQSNMYGHGYAMLYLSQVYGMSGSRAVEDKLRRSHQIGIPATPSRCARDKDPAVHIVKPNFNPAWLA